MADKYLIGIDVGTAGSKGVITDLDGRVLAHRAFEHATASPKPGWYEHDAERVWWGDIKLITRALIEGSNVSPRDVAGVCISALCPDMVPLDSAGRPLRPAILYGIDTRAQAEQDAIEELLGRDFIFEKSGMHISAQSITPKIMWFQRNEPELYARTRMIHSATGYLTFKLTGSHVVDVGTGTFYNPILDRHTLSWDYDVARELGIDPALLPRVAYGSELAGHVTPQAAAETGLAEGTPVAVGCCDASAENISVGAVQPGDGGLSYGSTMSFLVIGDKTMKPHPLMALLPFVFPGTLFLGSGIATTGSLTRWFRDNFGHVEMETERLVGLNAFQMLSDQASCIPAGSEGLLVLPYFAGERSPIWDTQARGMILGLTLSHTRSHVYRAILEATAYAQRHNMEVIAGGGVPIRRVISTGGGTRSRLWTQIISDVTGYPQEVASSPYGSPLGDAFVAGCAAGLFKDFDVLHTKWVRDVQRVEPNLKAKRVYDEYYGIYREAYGHVKQEMHALARLSCQIESAGNGRAS